MFKRDTNVYFWDAHVFVTDVFELTRACVTHDMIHIYIYVYSIYIHALYDIHMDFHTQIDMHIYQMYSARPFP